MKQIIKRSLVVALYIGIILLSTKVYASTGKTVNDTTRIRKEASTSSETLTLIDKNTEVEILSDEGEWYKIKYSNLTGYIRKDMLSVTESSETNEASNGTTKETAEETSNEDANVATQNEASKDNLKNESQVENTLKKGYLGKLTASLDMKILPSINSSVIATIYENTEFKIADVINKWAYIETENNSGWVLIGKLKSDENVVNTSNKEDEKTSEGTQENTKTEENQITEENQTTEENKKTEENTTSNGTKTTTTIKYVSVETLNLREKADNSAKIIRQLTLNSEVTVVEIVDSTWSKVTYKGTTGYVASKFLSDSKVKTTSRSEDTSRETTTSETENTSNTSKSSSLEDTSEKTSGSSRESTSSSTGASVVSYAKQFLGNPYVYGGTSLTNGCDCSGFVMSVYAHFGYTLPHSSTSMRSVGTAVDKANLQPGDIVCFSGHVGIYIGGNTFIHAANVTKGIITTSLSDSYYTAKYVGARRVIN